MKARPCSFCIACWYLLATTITSHTNTRAFLVTNTATPTNNPMLRQPRMSRPDRTGAPGTKPQSPSRPRQSMHQVMLSHSGHGRRSSGGMTADNIRSRSGTLRPSVGGITAMSAESAPGEGGNSAYYTAKGPGAGVIDLRFKDLKAGGFKVFLLFFLLGQGRAADNDVPFQVRDTSEGIRLLIGADDNAAEWDGVLDLSWGVDPQPYFRVDRIDTAEVIPYPGELYILNKLLDAIIDVNGERSIGDKQKLFLLPLGDSQLAAHKSKLASMAALGN